MLARGTNPEWNVRLTEAHAAVVENAMRSPLCYAAILEKHLGSITSTLLRTVRLPHAPLHRHNTKIVMPAEITHPKRLYTLTESDVKTGTDEFLERQGDPSYQMPFHRDNYYNQSMSAYVPNRKWSKEEQRWIYYAAGGHERDLAWTRAWFAPKRSDGVDEQAFIASFKAAMTT